MKKVDYAKISCDNVKLLLSQNKMSVRQLAERIQIAPTTLNDSLKSKKGVSIDALIKIADFFGITVNDLCDENFSNLNINKKAYNNFTLMNKFSLLDTHGKELVMIVIDKELERVSQMQ